MCAAIRNKDTRVRLNHTLERVTEKIASQPFVKTALLTQIEEQQTFKCCARCLKDWVCFVERSN